MKLAKITFLIFFALVLTSCMIYRLVPQKEAESEIRYNRGRAIQSKIKDRIGVAISTEVNGRLVYYHIIVRNFREQNIHVDDYHTTLVEKYQKYIFFQNIKYSNNLKVYHADEYYQMEKDQILTGQTLMAVSAAMSAAIAGQSTSYTSGSYSSNSQSRNSYYSGYGTYSSTTYTYDSAKAAMERDIAFANVRDYVNGTNQELEFLRNTLFYPSDIDTGKEYYGIIVSELGDTTEADMKLTLKLEGIEFIFSFQKEHLSYGTKQ